MIALVKVIYVVKIPFVEESIGKSQSLKVP